MKKLVNIILIIALGVITESAGCSELSSYGPSRFYYISLTDGTNRYFLSKGDRRFDTLVIGRPSGVTGNAVYKSKAPRNIDKVVIESIFTSGEPGSYTNKQIGDSVRVGVIDSITFHSKHGWNITYRFILEYEEETN